MFAKQLPKIEELSKILISIYGSSYKDSEKFWLIFNLLKFDFFQCIKKYYEKEILREIKLPIFLDLIYDSLIQRWENLNSCLEKTGFKKSVRNKLKGIIYEALFYNSVIREEVLHNRNWWQKFINDQNLTFLKEEPPKVEIIPFFEIIPHLQFVRSEKGLPRKISKIFGDFYIRIEQSESGFRQDILVDVKSSEPEEVWEKFLLQAKSASYNRILFWIVFPKKDVKFPKSLDDWDMKGICPICKNFTKEHFRICRKCYDITQLFWEIPFKKKKF